MADYAILPLSELDTTYSLPSGGTTHVCTTAGHLTTALSSAVGGDVIQLAAGTTFTGNFVLPNKVSQSDSAWIYIISSGYASLPAPGTRIATADAANMATILTTTDTAAATAIRADYGAHNYRFVGIKIASDAPTAVTTNIVLLGYNSSGIGAAAEADLADNIVFDRCWIAGPAAKNNLTGITGCCARFGFIDSRIDEMHHVTDESHGIQLVYGTGPVKIQNNFIEAAGINVFFCDSSSTHPEWRPTDVTVKGNYLHKPDSWNTVWDVKNLIETKGSLRLLIDSNIIDNSWVDGQTGYAMLIKGGGGDTVDTTVRNNIIRNANIGFEFVPSVADKSINRLTAYNNLLYNIYSRLMEISASVADKYFDLIIEHNTALHSAVPVMSPQAITLGSVPLGLSGVRIANNILNRATYGVLGDSQAEGINSVVTYISNYLFDTNVIIGGPGGSPYANNTNYVNWFLPANAAAVGFTDIALAEPDDFALTAGSAYHNAATDGTDIGADIAALIIATTGVLDGTWISGELVLDPTVITEEAIPRILANTIYPTNNQDRLPQRQPVSYISGTGIRRNTTRFSTDRRGITPKTTGSIVINSAEAGHINAKAGTFPGIVDEKYTHGLNTRVGGRTNRFVIDANRASVHIGWDNDKQQNNTFYYFSLGSELITNGGMTSNLTGWTLSGNSEWSSVYDGSALLPDSGVISQTITVEANTLYKLSADLYSTGDIDFYVLTTGYVEIDSEGHTATVTPETHSMIFDSGDNTSIIIYLKGSSGGPNYIKNVSVFKAQKDIQSTFGSDVRGASYLIGGKQTSNKHF